MIASFSLTNITHMRIGGYNAKNKSIKLNEYFEYPREQSLKGLWRWWLRVLLSGTALSDNEIKRNVCELLGSSDIPAKFRLKLLVSNGITPPEPIIDQQGLKDLANPNQSRPRERTNLFNRLFLPSRLVLSVMDRNLDRLKQDELLSVYHPNKLKILIEIYGESKTGLDILVIYSLVLAITFSGIGSITRRGFGKFAFEEIAKGPYEITNTLESIRNSKTTLELETSLKRLIENAAKTAEKTFSTRRVNGFPKHPTLDFKGSYFKLKVVALNDSFDSKKVLHKIGKASLKSEWKKLKFGNVSSSLFKSGQRCILGY